MEPRCKEVPENWENVFVITGARYIRILFRTCQYNRAEEYRSLYRGFCFKRGRYIGIAMCRGYLAWERRFGVRNKKRDCNRGSYFLLSVITRCLLPGETPIYKWQGWSIVIGAKQLELKIRPYDFQLLDNLVTFRIYLTIFQRNFLSLYKRMIPTKLLRYRLIPSRLLVEISIKNSAAYVHVIPVPYIKLAMFPKTLDESHESLDLTDSWSLFWFRKKKSAFNTPPSPPPTPPRQKKL